MDSATDKKLYTFAYTLWCLGLVLLIGVDYLIRKFSTRLYELGMPEGLWFSMQTLLALAALMALYRAVHKKRLRSKLLHCLLGVIVGGAFYIVLLSLYIIGTGVDSL